MGPSEGPVGSVAVALIQLRVVSIDRPGLLVQLLDRLDDEVARVTGAPPEVPSPTMLYGSREVADSEESLGLGVQDSGRHGRWCGCACWKPLNPASTGLGKWPGADPEPRFDGVRLAEGLSGRDRSVNRWGCFFSS